METADLAAEIDRRLRAAGRAERRKALETYVPTALEVLGLAVPELRKVVRDVSRRLHEAPPVKVLALVHALIDQSTLEGRQTAYELLNGHAAAMASLRTRAVEGLGRGMDNWGSVDGFGVLVSGPAWRNRQVTEAAVDCWARSRDRWWRRAALVSTAPLNMRSRGGTGDTSRTLRICECLAGDRDDMVAKGLSWALRALIVPDRAAVQGFLDTHRRALPKRVLREVRNKLETGLKTPKG